MVTQVLLKTAQKNYFIRIFNLLENGDCTQVKLLNFHLWIEVWSILRVHSPLRLQKCRREESLKDRRSWFLAKPRTQI